MQRWRVLNEELVLSKPWLTVRCQRVETASGHVIQEYHLLDTKDWALIVCITEQRELVLVRQYRLGVDLETLEFPAGALEPGEAALTAAQRELLEETGYQAESWELLHVVAPETTRHRHRAHLFLARGAKRTSEQALDAAEDVAVELLPAEQLEQLATDGTLLHGVHVAAALLAARRLTGP